MRRKSERAASKKNASPEKKVEKLKRGRSRRKKQSTSSDNESADEASTKPQEESVGESQIKPPVTPVKEENPDEAQDQVWQVKTADTSGDAGEIQKLKICLKRPPSTPERAERSPRSKRKHSRATSSSDTPSNEGVEDKKKSKHRSKRSRESKDDSDKGQDVQGDEPETESESQTDIAKADEVTQSETSQETVVTETPMSTTNEGDKPEESASSLKTSDEPSQDVEQSSESEQKNQDSGNEKQNQPAENEPKNQASDADTTVDSPKPETTVVSTASENESTAETTIVAKKPEPTDVSPLEESDNQNTSETKDSDEKGSDTAGNAERKSSISEDKSEILEIHPEETKCESADKETCQPKDETDDGATEKEVKETAAEDAEVSKIENKIDKQEAESTNDENVKAINEPGIVVTSESETKSRKMSTDSQNKREKHTPEHEKPARRDLERSDSIQSTQEETVANGQTPITVSRKRRWGSRVSKVGTQKSLTISTDILKEIIPDVKPTEFNEVIEEKKHRRIEVTEKIERPILPRIVIDNSESIEQLRKEKEEKERDTKGKDSHLALNRKISIVKDNDNIIARPPSPPKHKQSSILYITNLVRPFTLPQLKNLLQRTGRIMENGFWIDRIKSKCFVKYETEDQAVETRHALHGVTWPVSNPKALQVDFSTEEAFNSAKDNEESDNAKVSTIPGTVEDWLREQDMKRERGELEKPWERKITREWDLGKSEKEKEKDKDKDRQRREERPLEKRRHRSPEKTPEPARKFKKKEEEAPAKLLDDLFRKTKTTPSIYWLPLSAETIAIKEEQRRQHMAEHERRMQELRRPHRGRH